MSGILLILLVYLALWVAAFEAFRALPVVCMLGGAISLLARKQRHEDPRLPKARMMMVETASLLLYVGGAAVWTHGALWMGLLAATLSYDAHGPYPFQFRLAGHLTLSAALTLGLTIGSLAWMSRRRAWPIICLISCLALLGSGIGVATSLWLTVAAAPPEFRSPGLVFEIEELYLYPSPALAAVLLALAWKIEGRSSTYTPLFWSLAALVLIATATAGVVGVRLWFRYT